MAEGIALTLVIETVRGLVTSLLDIKDCVKHNRATVQEIEEFIDHLNKNVSRLKARLPATVNGDAIESLLVKLKEASVFTQSHHRGGYFKTIWSAKETKDRLGELRRDLDSAFQMALLLTNLEVALHTDKKTSNFQLEMLRVYKAHASDAAQARDDLQKILQLLIHETNPSNKKLRSVMDMVEDMNQTDQSEIEKFFADVLASIASASETIKENSVIDEDDLSEEFCDPITLETMCDPVKASDGYTYDRWTIIHRELTESPFVRSKNKPFIILCDDISVRRRLFDRYGSMEAQFRERRQKYREEALRLAVAGYDADSLVMIQNILVWNDDDTECQKVRQLLLNRKHPQSVDSTSLDVNVASKQDLDDNQESEVDQLLQALEDIESLTNGTLKESDPRSAIAIGTLFKEFKELDAIAAAPGVLEKLLDLLQRNNVTTSTEEGIISLFASITENADNIKVFASLPGSVKTVVNSLANWKRPRLQFWAVNTTAALAAAPGYSEWGSIVSYFSEGLLTNLQNLLSEEIEPSTRREALRAIRLILEKKSSTSAIDMALFPNLMNVLCKNIHKHRRGDEDLIETSLALMFRFCDSCYYSNRENATALARVRGLGESLLDLLTDRQLENVGLKSSALQTASVILEYNYNKMLSSRIENIQEMKIKIATFCIENDLAQKVREDFIRSPSTLSVLLGLLQRGRDPQLQGQALLALMALTIFMEGAACVAGHADLLVDFFSRDRLGEFQNAGFVLSRVMIILKNLLQFDVCPPKLHVKILYDTLGILNRSTGKDEWVTKVVIHLSCDLLCALAKNRAALRLHLRQTDETLRRVLKRHERNTGIKESDQGD